MENEEGEVEIEELHFKFCLIHVLYIIIPYVFTKLLRVYRVSKEVNKTNKMIIMGVEHVIAFPNLFTYYEQDMVKSIIFFDYYNNVYQGWSGKW
jgi:hypothetical protein